MLITHPSRFSFNLEFAGNLPVNRFTRLGFVFSTCVPTHLPDFPENPPKKHRQRSRQTGARRSCGRRFAFGRLRRATRGVNEFWWFLLPPCPFVDGSSFFCSFIPTLLICSFCFVSYFFFFSFFFFSDLCFLFFVLLIFFLLVFILFSWIPMPVAIDDSWYSHYCVLMDFYSLYLYLCL